MTPTGASIASLSARWRHSRNSRLKTFVSLWLPFTPSSELEIQTTTDHKPSLSGCGCDASKGDAGSCGPGNSSGTRAVDVHVRYIEIGMIQHIDRVHAKFKFFRLGNPHTLDQVRVEPKQRRSLDRIPAKIADLSRGRIRKNHTALRIGNRLVAECSAEPVRRRHVGN